MMLGQGNIIESGWRWDVFADFACNMSGVRVGSYKTRAGAARFAKKFYKAIRPNVECTFIRIRHSFPEKVTTKRSKRR